MKLKIYTGLLRFTKNNVIVSAPLSQTVKCISTVLWKKVLSHLGWFLHASSSETVFVVVVEKNVFENSFCIVFSGNIFQKKIPTTSI